MCRSSSALTLFVCCRCRCSPPANASADVQQTWSNKNLTFENIPWEQLGVKVPLALFLSVHRFRAGSQQHLLLVRGTAAHAALFSLQDCRDLHGSFTGSGCSHDGPYVPDVLFWSVILFFTTFFLSSFLKQIKNMRYFPTKVCSSSHSFL